MWYNIVMERNKILIVEDEITLLTILKDKFSLEGFTVLATQSGEKAYEIAKEEKPDLILTDLIMYPLDGISLIRKIRESSEWGRKVPCVILSNEKRDDLKIEIGELNITKYINKADIPIDMVVDQVKEILK